MHKLLHILIFLLVFNIYYINLAFSSSYVSANDFGDKVVITVNAKPDYISSSSGYSQDTASQSVTWVDTNLYTDGDPNGFYFEISGGWNPWGNETNNYNTLCVLETKEPGSQEIGVNGEFDYITSSYMVYKDSTTNLYTKETRDSDIIKPCWLTAGAGLYIGFFGASGFEEPDIVTHMKTVDIVCDPPYNTDKNGDGILTIDECYADGGNPYNNQAYYKPYTSDQIIGGVRCEASSFLNDPTKNPNKIKIMDCFETIDNQTINQAKFTFEAKNLYKNKDKALVGKNERIKFMIYDQYYTDNSGKYEITLDRGISKEKTSGFLLEKIMKTIEEIFSVSYLNDNYSVINNFKFNILNILQNNTNILLSTLNIKDYKYIDISLFNKAQATTMSSSITEQRITDEEDLYQKKVSLIKRFYDYIVYDSVFIKTVKILIMLYISFLGLNFAMGGFQYSVKEFMNIILKLVFILSFLSESGWSIYNEYIVTFFLKGLMGATTYLINIVNKTYSPNSYIYIPEGTSLSSIFINIDSSLIFYFNDVITNKIWSLCFAAWYGIIIVVFIYMTILFFFVKFISSTFPIMIAYIELVLGLIIGPVFVSFYLFKETQSFFMNWLAFLGARAANIFFTVFILTIFAETVKAQFVDLLSFPVYFKELIPSWLQTLSQWAFGVNLSWKVPIPNFSNSKVVDFGVAFIIIAKVFGLVQIFSLILNSLPNIVDALVEIKGGKGGSMGQMVGTGNFIDKADAVFARITGEKKGQTFIKTMESYATPYKPVGKLAEYIFVDKIWGGIKRRSEKNELIKNNLENRKLISAKDEFRAIASKDSRFASIINDDDILDKLAKYQLGKTTNLSFSNDKDKQHLVLELLKYKTLQDKLGSFENIGKYVHKGKLDLEKFLQDNPDALTEQDKENYRKYINAQLSLIPKFDYYDKLQEVNKLIEQYETAKDEDKEKLMKDIEKNIQYLEQLEYAFKELQNLSGSENTPFLMEGVNMEKFGLSGASDFQTVAGIGDNFLGFNGGAANIVGNIGIQLSNTSDEDKEEKPKTLFSKLDEMKIGVNYASNQLAKSRLKEIEEQLKDKSLETAERKDLLKDRNIYRQNILDTNDKLRKYYGTEKLFTELDELTKDLENSKNNNADQDKISFITNNRDNVLKFLQEKLQNGEITNEQDIKKLNKILEDRSIEKVKEEKAKRKEKEEKDTIKELKKEEKITQDIESNIKNLEKAMQNIQEIKEKQKTNKKEIQQKENEIKAIEQDFIHTNKDPDSIKRNTQCIRDIDMFKKNIRERREKIARLKQESKDIQEQLESLENLRNNGIREQDIIGKKFKNEKIKEILRNNGKVTNKDLNNEIQKLNKKNSEIQKTIQKEQTSLESDKIILNSKISEIEKQLSKEQFQKYKTLHDELHELKKTEKSLSQELKQKEKEYEKYIKNTKENKSKTHEERLQEEHERQNQKLKEIQKRLDKASAKYKNLIKNKKDKDDLKEFLSNEQKNIKEEKDSIERQIKEIEASKVLSDIDKETKRKQLNQEKENIEKWEKQLNDYIDTNNKIKELKEKQQRIQTRIENNSIKVELNKLDKEEKEYRELYNTEKITKETLNEKIKEIEANREKLKAKEEYKELQKQEEEIKNIQKQLEELKNKRTEQRDPIMDKFKQYQEEEERKRKEEEEKKRQEEERKKKEKEERKRQEEEKKRKEKEERKRQEEEKKRKEEEERKRKEEEKVRKQKEEEENKVYKKELKENQQQIEQNKNKIEQLQKKLAKLEGEVSKYDEKQIRKELSELKNNPLLKKRKELKQKYKEIKVSEDKQEEKKKILKELKNIKSESERINQQIESKNKQLSVIKKYNKSKELLNNLNKENKVLEKKQVLIKKNLRLKTDKDNIEQDIAKIDERIKLSNMIIQKQEELSNIKKSLEEKGVSKLPKTVEQYKKSQITNIEQEIKKYEELLKKPQDIRNDREEHIIKNTQKIDEISKSTTIKDKDNQIQNLKKINEILATDMLEAENQIRNYQTLLSSKKAELKQKEEIKKEIEKYFQSKKELDDLKNNPMYTTKTLEEQNKERSQKNEEIKNIDNKIKNTKDNLEITTERERIIREIREIKAEKEDLKKSETAKGATEEEIKNSQEYIELNSNLERLNQRLQDIKDFQIKVQETKEFKQRYKSKSNTENLENYMKAKKEKQEQREKIINDIQTERSGIPVKEPTAKPEIKKEKKREEIKDQEIQLSNNSGKIRSNKQQIEKLKNNLEYLETRISKYNEERIKDDLFRLEKQLAINNTNKNKLEKTLSKSNKAKDQETIKKQEKILEKLEDIDTKNKSIEEKINSRNKKLAEIRDYRKQTMELENLTQNTEILEKKQAIFNKSKQLTEQKEQAQKELITIKQDIDKRLELSETISLKQAELLDREYTLKEKGLDSIPKENKYESKFDTSKLQKYIDNYKDSLSMEETNKSNYLSQIEQNKKFIENTKNNTSLPDVNKQQTIAYYEELNKELLKKESEATKRIDEYEYKINSKQEEIKQREAIKEELREYYELKNEIEALKKTPGYTSTTFNEQKKQEEEKIKEIKNIDTRMTNLQDNLEIVNERERILKEIQEIKQNQKELEDKVINDIDEKIRENKWQQSVNQKEYDKLDATIITTEDQDKRSEELKEINYNLQQELTQLEDNKKMTKQTIESSPEYIQFNNELEKLNQRLEDIQNFQQKVQETKEYKQQYNSTHNDEDLENYRNAKAEKQRQRDELIKKIHEEKSGTPEAETVYSDSSSSTPFSDSKPAETPVDKPIEKPIEELKPYDTSKPLEEPSIKPETRDEKPEGKPVNPEVEKTEDLSNTNMEKREDIKNDINKNPFNLDDNDINTRDLEKPSFSSSTDLGMEELKPETKPAKTSTETPVDKPIEKPIEEPKLGDTSKPLEELSIKPETRDEKPEYKPIEEPKEERINDFKEEKVDTSKNETVTTIENPLGKEKPDIDDLYMSTHMEPESKIEENTTMGDTIKKEPSSSSGDDMNIDMYFNELGMEQNSPTNTASPVNNETLTQTDNFELNNSNTHTYTSTNETTFEQEKMNIPETSTNIDPELQQLSSSIFNPTIEQKDKSSPVYLDESINAPENIDEPMFNMGTNQEKPLYDSSYMHTNNSRDSETINIFSDNLDNQSNYSNSYEPVPDIHNPVKENTPVFETQEEQQFESQPIEDITTTQSKNNLDLQTERNLDNDFDNYYQPDQNASTQTQSVESTNNTQNDYNLDQNSNSKTLVFETPIELSIDTEDNSTSSEGIKLDSNTQSSDSHLDMQSPEIKEEETISTDSSYTHSTQSELDSDISKEPKTYEKYEPEEINFELDKSNDSKVIQEETQDNIKEEKIDTTIDNKPSNSKGDNMDIDLNDLIMEQDSSTNTMPSFDNEIPTRIDNTELETSSTSPLYDSTPETYVSSTPTKEETIAFETQAEQPLESPSTIVEQPFESSYTSMEKSLDSSSTPIENPAKSPDNSMAESIFGPKKEPDPLFDSLENTRTEDKEQNKTPMDYTGNTLNKQEDEYIAPSTLNEALQYSMSNDSHYATIQQDFNQIKDILTDNTYRYNPNDDFTPIIDVLEQEYKNIKDNTEKQKFAKKVTDKLNEYYFTHEEESDIDLANFMNDLKESGFIHDSSTNTDSEDKK